MSTEPRVLVVDDDVSITELLSDLLEAEGYKIVVFNSSKDVLYLARQFLPDVLLLDIMMPEFDGYEVCRYFKSDSELRFTRIIVLTARDTAESRLTCYQAGADLFVSKPFDIDELRLLVKNHAESKRAVETLLNEAREQSMVEPVTQSYSSRYMERRLQDELKRVERHQRPFSLVLMDLDRFENLNIRHGYEFGHAVLRAVTDGVRREIRESDILGRYQDAFLLLLPETGIDGATSAATRLEEIVASLEFPERKKVSISATAVHNTVNGGKPEVILANLEDRLRKAQSRKLGTRGHE